MAKRVETLFVDDLDGGEADKTIEFSVDGNAYEIDLSDKHASEFYDAVAKYVANARTVRVIKPRKVAVPARKSNGHSPLAMTPQLRAEIRAWAQAHPELAGSPVGDRGKLKESVIENYRKTLAS